MFLNDKDRKYSILVALWAKSAIYGFLVVYCINAVSALTLLVGRQEGHPACKN